MADEHPDELGSIVNARHVAVEKGRQKGEDRDGDGEPQAQTDHHGDDVARTMEQGAPGMLQIAAPAVHELWRSHREPLRT